MGYSFRLAARVLLYAPSNRQDSTYNGLCYTSRGALDGTRKFLFEMPINLNSLGLISGDVVVIPEPYVNYASTSSGLMPGC